MQCPIKVVRSRCNNVVIIYVCINIQPQSTSVVFLHLQELIYILLRPVSAEEDAMKCKGNIHKIILTLRTFFYLSSSTVGLYVYV